MKLHPRLLDKSNRIVAGHRGMMAIYPENTLYSFEQAIALGVDMLELDINVTRDGELVVIHDLTVDRTTSGSGAVRSLSLAEIQRLDAGSRKAPNFSKLRVPSLEEFCQLMRQHPHVLLNVEIKDKTDECVDKTIAMLDKHGLIPLCVFTCFDADIIKLINQKYELPTQGFPGFRMQNFVPGLKGSIQYMQAVGIEMSLLTPERVQDYEQLGILPWAYCPDTDTAAAYARYCDAWLVTTNNPEPSLRIFKA